MQGIDAFIPTEVKATYLNALLQVGFDTIDFGSFVSPKAIPQMRDTAQVLEKLDLDSSRSKLLAIVANGRGCRDAIAFDQITYIGFPLSISETFQQRNTNKSIAEALTTVAEIQELCTKRGKTQVVYISMGFGNPYGDPYNPTVVLEFVDILQTLGVRIISLADTVGLATTTQISTLISAVRQHYVDIELGAHLHSSPQTTEEKIAAAFQAGCERFDGALGGRGGCPMANDHLVGNLATEKLVDFLVGNGVRLDLDRAALERARALVSSVFPN